MLASIIIPTYNRLWCLPEAIASCPQSPDIEIIVVDDGSSDGTWEWLTSEIRHPRLRPIRQVNWGKPIAVNAGLRAARGEYVKFLDSDDLCVPDAVQKHLDLCLAERPDVSPASYLETGQHRNAEVFHKWRPCGDFIAQQFGECDSSHYSAYFFRREFVAEIPHRPEFAYCDDRMFILECALRQPKVTDFTDCTLIHRHHEKGRLQFRQGSVAIATNLQKWQMYKKIGALLESGDLMTTRRRIAPSRDLYALAQRVSGYNWTEGKEILSYLLTQNPDFRPEGYGRDKLYRIFGFSTAQLMVNSGRMLRGLARNFH